MSRDARLSDRIKQLSFDPSTGSFALDSVATGFSPFSEFYEEGDVVFYAATDGTRYEMGSGEYTSNTITRYPLRSNQISSGPYYIDAPSARETDAGVTGVWHPLYLTKSAASGMRGYNVAGGAVSPASGVHEHVFSGYPGVTFYMPNMETAGHAQASSVTKSGENYATSGAPVSFQGVTEVFVTYPGKYSVFSAGGISGFSEPKSKGVAFWGNEQTLDYDSDIVWDTGVNALGVSQPSPVHPIDVGGLTSYSQVRASGFIGGGSGVAFSGGQALPQSSLKTASGGRQLEPFFRNELDNQTKSDQVFSLSGLVDERLLLQQQIKGSIFAGPVSGCTATCSPDYPEFRYLESEDIPDLSSLYVVQQNYFPASDIPEGAVAFTNASGKIEFNQQFVFSKSNNRLGINTISPEVALSVNGDIRASGDIGVSGNAEINSNLTVGGNVVVSGSLDVQGDVTYIDSTQVMVVDKQLELASMSGAAFHNHGALDSGGIVLKSTDGDQFWIYSSGSLDGSAYDPAWLTDADIWTSGGAIRFNDGPTISGGYHAGSGLELHNGVAFNIGNMFQVSGNATATSGANILGWMHQGDTLQVSGISGVHASFFKIPSSGEGGGGSGVITIDPTHMYNALSGAIIQVDGADNNWKIHVTSGSYPDQPEQFPQGHVLDTIDVALAVSGVSGISLNYDATNNGLFISAQPVSGYFESRIGGLAGGYGNWKIHASGHNSTQGEAGQVLDEITTGQAFSVSGVSGVDIDYTITDNFMSFSAAPISGWISGVLGLEGLASGVTQLVVNSGNLVLAVASGLASTSLTFGSGVVRQDGVVDLRHDGSGTLKHLSFHHGVRIGDGAGVGISGLEAPEPETSFGGHPDSGIAPAAVFIGSHAGSGSINPFPTSGIFIGHEAGALSSGNQDSIFIGRSAGLSSDEFSTDASGQMYDNIGIGRNSARVLLNSDNSTFIGLEAGHKASGNQSTVAVGKGAANGVENSEDSVFIGTNAGYHSTGIVRSNIIGRAADSGAVNFDETNMIGYRAGAGAISEGLHIAFPVSGINNFIGSNAGADSYHCSFSNFIGKNAGLRASGITGSIGIGENVYNGAISGFNNVALGPESQASSSGNNHVTAIGFKAGSLSSGNKQCIYIGDQAGYMAGDSGHHEPNLYCTAIGSEAMRQSSGNQYCDAVGQAAGMDTHNNKMTFMGGQGAGLSSQEVRSSVLIGQTAGYYASGILETVLIGYQAGMVTSRTAYLDTNAGFTFKNSVLIGDGAAQQSSGINSSVYLGENAGANYGHNSLHGSVADQKIEYTIAIGQEAGWSSAGLSTAIQAGDYNLIIEPTNRFTKRSSWCDPYQDYIVSIGYLLHGYSDPVAESRHLQIGAQPTSLSTLQESTLSIKPDGSTHVPLYIRRALSQSADMLKVESSWNDQSIITEQGILQIPVATSLGSVGDYSTMRLAGSTTAVDSSPGSIVLFDDGSTELLLICGADGTWLKLQDELVPA